ncbi:uncharacterized protein LODBEIA_P57370 [Lodderomyces beijingensis]|uniref:HTH CENPB-type domain-containing protein n=1 Tax=Lodderomyces beijingensis TaxID=1775926 RepID=A0ABP0ZFN7_9ASCO
MSTKLPRATLAQKLHVLDYFHQSDSPQLKTVDKFKEQLSISTSSLSEWLKNEPELRRRYSEAKFKSSKNAKRNATFKYEDINKAMDKFVQERLARNGPISEPVLREQWARYAQQYGVDDPKRLHSFSHGWLSQFRKRHGIKTNKVNKERGRVSKYTQGQGTSVSQKSQEPGSGHDGLSPPASISIHQGADCPIDVSYTSTQSMTPSEFNHAAMFRVETETTETAETRQARPPSVDADQDMDADFMCNHEETHHHQRSNHKSNLHGSGAHSQLANASHPAHPAQLDLSRNGFGVELQFEKTERSGRGHQQGQDLHTSTLRSSQAMAHNNVSVPQRVSSHQMNQLTPKSANVSNRVPRSNGPPTIVDVERFIFVTGDKFFHNHQQSYPNTFKLFQKFKESYFDEKYLAESASVDQIQSSHSDPTLSE